MKTGKNTEKQDNKTSPRLLGATIIWALVILTTASTLRGTTYLTQILPVLGGGAATNIILLTSRKQ